MATSSLSSLGLGSDGALSYDVIDQLKAVDESAEITPIESKISDTQTKQSDLSQLITYTATLKSSISSLSDEITYLKRTSTVTGDAVNVNAASGTAIQDFSIDVKTLALRDIYQSNSFTSNTSTFTSANDTITLNINGEDFSISVDATTTLSELKDKINDTTNGKITASLLNVGGDEPYRLILKSDDTGSDNAITITSIGDSTLDLGLANYTYTGTASSDTYSAGTNGSDTLTFTINGSDYSISVDDGEDINDIQSKIESTFGNVLHASVVDGALVLESQYGDMSVSSTYGSDTLFGLDGMEATQDNHIQTANNALFEYNGISITRSSNTVNDLIVGVDITLQDTGISNISISQDTSILNDNVNSFISAYNDLMSNLNETIKYDSDTKASGSLQGVSEIVGLKSSINRQLLSVNNTGISLADYGIALNESGYLELDSTTFDSILSSDPEGLENFFRGSTTINTTSLYGKTVNSGTIDITSGDFSINGTSIVLNINGTAEENAQALKNAINEANIDGIVAYINEANSSIYLRSTSGQDIQISGNSTQLALLGFKAGTTYGTSDTTTGFFTDFNTLLKSYIDTNNSTLNLLSSNYSNLLDSLNEEKTTTQERLDTKYEIMATKFAAYDSMISQLNTQYNTLAMMIDQASSSSSNS